MKTFAAFVGEIRSYSTENDADRFEMRLTRLRRGLHDLLMSDDALDDQMLASLGITADDKKLGVITQYDPTMTVGDEPPVREHRTRKPRAQ